MNRMREKAKAAGLEGVHWNLVAWGNPILPGEEVPANIPELIRKLGFDSSTSYVWIHHVPLPNVQTDYNYVRDKYFEHWDQANEEYGAPYILNVTMGWNSTPRCDSSSEWKSTGYPFMNTLDNNTPENFKKTMQIKKEKMLSNSNSLKIIKIERANV